MDATSPGTDTLSPVGDLLGQLRLAVSQLRLYPKGSPQVQKIASGAWQAVAYQMARRRGTLTLSATPRGILVNGRRPRDPAGLDGPVERAVLEILREARIRSVTFRKGLTLEELVTFLHALTRKFWDLKEGREINARLREERVFQVAVDEVEYVAVAEGDLVIRDAATKLGGTDTRLSEVMTTLDRLLESTLEQGVASEARLRIMQKLLDRDPSLLDRMRPAPPGGLDLEEARQALGDIARLLRTADPIARHALRSIAQLLLRTLRDRPEVAEPMRKFLSGEAAELIPAWMHESVAVAATEPGAVRRAAALLTLSDAERFDAVAREGPALTRELASLGRDDLVRSLLLFPAECLGERSSRQRAAACRAMEALRPVLESHATEEIRARVEERVCAALPAETDEKTYGLLAGVAADLIDFRLRRSLFGLALKMLEVLWGHYGGKKAGQPWRSASAFQALERVVSSAGMAPVLAGLRDRNPEAGRVVESLGAAAAPPLLRELLAAESPGERTMFAESLSKAGPTAAAVVVEECRRAASPTDAMRLIEALPLAVPNEMAEVALAGFLNHSVSPVRRRASTLLGERAYPHSGTLLMDALRAEPEPSARAAILEALGRLRHAPAAAVLRDIADSRSESEEGRAAACLALSRMGDAASVPLLARLCQRGARGITRIFIPVSPAVRAAAARSLGQFPGSEEAREALRRAREDPDATVRAAACESLYASLHGAFGDLVREVQLVSAVQELRTEDWKLAGSLTEIPLDQVCQLIGNSGKIGVLMVNADGRVGKVYFEQGCVTAAEYDGREDQEAFTMLFRKRSGYFLFQPGEVSPARRLRLPVTQVLLEAARQADEGREKTV